MQEDWTFSQMVIVFIVCMCGDTGGDTTPITGSQVIMRTSVNNHLNQTLNGLLSFSMHRLQVMSKNMFF